MNLATSEVHLIWTPRKVSIQLSYTAEVLHDQHLPFLMNKSKLSKTLNTLPNVRLQSHTCVCTNLENSFDLLSLFFAEGEHHISSIPSSSRVYCATETAEWWLVFIDSVYSFYLARNIDHNKQTSAIEEVIINFCQGQPKTSYKIYHFILGKEYS